MKFIISESQYNRIFEGVEEDKCLTDTTDYLSKLCYSSKSTTSGPCRLKGIRHSLNDSLKDDLKKSICILYNFFGRKNVGVLPKIIDLSLQNTDRTVYYLKTISDFIGDDAFNEDETKKQLNQLRNMNIIPDDLEILLRTARQKEYEKYENEFVGEYFDANRTRLSLNYKCGDSAESSFLKVIFKFRELTHDEFVKELNIIKNCIVDSLEDNLAVKSDVKSKRPLYVEEDGEKVEVFSGGSVFEIKKMDTNIDSYLSEFFSVFKQTKNEEFKSNNLVIYNRVIQGIFEWLDKNGDSFLEKVKANMSGIIYDNYVIIPINFIEFYWSNMGQRGCNERRLSIRFRIKPEFRGDVIPGYIFTKESDVLKKQDVKVSSKDVTKYIC